MIDSGDPTVTGTPANIQNRVQGVVPRRWWSWTAWNTGIVSAIVGGLSDLASWCYSLIPYAKAQTRLATAYGVWLDIWSYDFLGMVLPRNGAIDDAFRVLIKTMILQERVTRAGMSNVINQLTSAAPAVFEPWNTGDTGAYSSPRANGFKCGQFGYGVGNGGYGNMNLPGQVFIGLFRTGFSGIPNVDGWGGSSAGYGVGTIEYAGKYTTLTGITNQMILDAIENTKPTGVTCWVTFLGSPTPSILTSESGAILTSENSSELLAK
ncbi:hypothetical protein [Bradyrhizobium sp. Tv2a-2]|uniref:hypothetical protein n=1 Tax=Bradyrhizobium sp. Tv2a-2 TaxID=113395 RepID=UPI00041F7857|nr:hypothetical protein [Bradyrhizobium sp. Tv2a-2]